MTTTSSIVQLKFNKLTNEQYSNITPVDGEFYITPGYDNITNCITEIPQDIKVGLNNGGLYLKAGCKYCVPNGFEQDGVTPHFDFVTVNADSSSTAYGVGRTGCMVVWSTDHFEWSTIGSFHSGSTQPSGGWWVWYDTANNKIKHFNGSTIVEGVSFPICMITENAGTGYDSTVKSIDHVFNGFGYIGSTVFALPGVKGLIPNGRNADGSLKNIDWTANKVITQTLTFGAQSYYFGVFNNNQKLAFYGKLVTKYDEKSNIIIDTYPDPDAIRIGWALFGECTADSNNRITSFTPKTAFHALDYNDSSTISGWAMPSSRYIDLTLGASGSTYTAPANGYFFFSKQATAANQEVYIAIAEPANEIYSWESIVPVSGQYAQITVPVKKGYKYKVLYALGGTTVAFRFIYAEGEV